MWRRNLRRRRRRIDVIAAVERTAIVVVAGAVMIVIVDKVGLQLLPHRRGWGFGHGSLHHGPSSPSPCSVPRTMVKLPRGTMCHTNQLSDTTPDSPSSSLRRVIISLSSATLRLARCSVSNPLATCRLS